MPPLSIILPPMPCNAVASLGPLHDGTATQAPPAFIVVFSSACSSATFAGRVFFVNEVLRFDGHVDDVCAVTAESMICGGTL